MPQTYPPVTVVLHPLVTYVQCLTVTLTSDLCSSLSGDCCMCQALNHICLQYSHFAHTQNQSNELHHSH